jgi:hypothetical protein
MKRCSHCSKELPIENFPLRKLSSGKMGRRGQCSDCIKERMKQNYKVRQENLIIVVPTDKFCSCCNQSKPKESFLSNRARKDGLSVYCSKCSKSYFKSQKRVEYDRKRMEKRKTQENYIQYHIQYRKKNMKRFVEYRAKIMKENPFERLKQCYRNRIRRVIKNKKISSQTMLGCDWLTFKKHIESKFFGGMNWDNHGFFGWHLDHIIPLATAKTEDDLYRLNHYTNLQPLWWRDNLSKNDKILENSNN